MFPWAIGNAQFLCIFSNRGDNNPYLQFLKEVSDKQASLIAKWMNIGFIHGVMNTDNMSISGETIDYGPCAFMDSYLSSRVFSSIDTGGRYAFKNQPIIGQWNIARLAETLLPLIDEDLEKAIRFGVTPGKKIIVFGNNDDARRTVFFRSHH